MLSSCRSALVLTSLISLCCVRCKARPNAQRHWCKPSMNIFLHYQWVEAYQWEDVLQLRHTLHLFSNSFAAISLHINQDFCIVFTSGTAMDADPPTPSLLLIRWEASKTLTKQSAFSRYVISLRMPPLFFFFLRCRCSIKRNDFWCKCTPICIEGLDDDSDCLWFVGCVEQLWRVLFYFLAWPLLFCFVLSSRLWLFVLSCMYWKIEIKLY